MHARGVPLDTTRGAASPASGRASADRAVVGRFPAWARSEQRRPEGNQRNPRRELLAAVTAALIYPLLLNTGGSFSLPRPLDRRPCRSAGGSIVGLDPSASALKLVTMRWRSTGRATARTSSRRRGSGLAARPGPSPPAPGTGSPAAGAPTDVIADELRHVAAAVGFGSRPRQPHKLHRVADHVVGHRHAADDLLQGQNLLAREAPA